MEASITHRSIKEALNYIETRVDIDKQLILKKVSLLDEYKGGDYVKRFKEQADDLYSLYFREKELETQFKAVTKKISEDENNEELKALLDELSVELDRNEDKISNTSEEVLAIVDLLKSEDTTSNNIVAPRNLPKKVDDTINDPNVVRRKVATMFYKYSSIYVNDAKEDALNAFEHLMVEVCRTTEVARAENALVDAFNEYLKHDDLSFVKDWLIDTELLTDLEIGVFEADQERDLLKSL
jgi:hypothetical protein